MWMFYFNDKMSQCLKSLSISCPEVHKTRMPRTQDIAFGLAVLHQWNLARVAFAYIIMTNCPMSNLFGISFISDCPCEQSVVGKVRWTRVLDPSSENLSAVDCNFKYMYVFNYDKRVFTKISMLVRDANLYIYSKVWSTMHRKKSTDFTIPVFQLSLWGEQLAH